MNKFRKRNISMNHSYYQTVTSYDIDLSKLKPIEIHKMNMLICNSIFMYSYYISCFSKSNIFANKYEDIEDIFQQNHKNIDLKTGFQLTNVLILNEILQYLIETFNFQPNEEFIELENIKSYLNAHFVCYRMFTKVIITSMNPKDRIYPIEFSLQGYQWLVKYANELCLKKHWQICELIEEKKPENAIYFQNEMNLCNEMIQLLPTKIDQLKKLK